MSPHKHFLNILKYFAIVAVGFSFAYGENVMAASSNALTVPSETTVNVAADQDSGANIEGSLIIAESTCAAGYTVSVSGGTDNNLYLNGDSTSEYIAPSTGTRLVPTTIIGEGKLNTWGISMSETIDVHSNTFFGLTNEIVPIFSKDSASADGGDQISVRYGASVSADKRAGLYKMSEGNTITYYLTTPVSCHSITIVYDGNGADDGNDMAVQHENVNLGDSLDLYASNYKRAGYGFAGWSTEQLDPNSATFANDLASTVSDGLVFGPNETITVNEDIMAYANPETNLLPLYAVWIRSAGNIQDWAGCNAMQEGDVTALTDTRDNNVYAVAKLADDNCWMIENLRLGTSGSNDESKAQGFGGAFRGLADSENENFAEVTTANSLYNSWPDIIGDHVAFRFPRYNGNNTENTVSSMTNADQNVFSYGNYYTWSAAVANTSVVERGEPETSICPAGWTLPHGGVDGNDGATGSLKGGFSYLDYQLGGTGADQRTVEASNRWRKYPNNYIYSGRISDNTIIDRNSYGGYWSSTVYHDGGGELWGNSSFRMSIGNSRVRPSLNDRRYFGFAVRCLAVNYHIVSFDANGGSGEMLDQSIRENISTNLNSNTFVAPNGYYFAGWNTEADGSGTSYANGASVSNLGDITLYAQWEKISLTINFDSGYYGVLVRKNTLTGNVVGAFTTSGSSFDAEVGEVYYMIPLYNTGKTFASLTSSVGTTTVGTYGYNYYTIADGANSVTLVSADLPTTSSINMQNLSTANCSSIPMAVMDVRDNEVYYIQRLADGNCWMLENLRLGGYTAIDLSPLDTNIDANYSLPKDNNIIPATFIAGAINSRQKATIVSGYGPGRHSVGVHYNYCAASGGSYCYDGTSGVDVADTLQDSSYDICPAGWRMPTGSSNGEYQALFSSYSNDVNSFNYAFSTVLSGLSREQSVSFGTNGYYWTSTLYSTSNMYNLDVTSNSFDSSSNTIRRQVGYSVRCMLGS